MFNSKTITHTEADKRRKARSQALNSAPSDQHKAAVRGVEKIAARLIAAGDPETGAELKALADKANRLLDERDEARAACEALNTDHVGEAVKAAASELVKKLPVAFPCISDAVAFCEKLPMSQARAAAVAQSNDKNRLTKTAMDAHRELVEVLAAAGRLAIGEQLDSVKSLRELALLGS